MVKLKTVLSYGAIVIAFFVLQAYLNRHHATGPAPAIVATTVAGDSFSLERFRGRPALVYFWATWCGICRTMEGTVSDIARDTPMITVATRSGNAAQIRRHLAERGLDLPVLADTTGDMADLYGIRGVPAFFVIDASGAIAFSSVGYTTEMGLRLRLWLAGTSLWQ